LLDRLVVGEILFVIRLNLGDQHKKSRLTDADVFLIKLIVRPDISVIYGWIYFLYEIPMI
jgi:hypothetical protein